MTPITYLERFNGRNKKINLDTENAKKSYTEKPASRTKIIKIKNIKSRGR